MALPRGVSCATAGHCGRADGGSVSGTFQQFATAMSGRRGEPETVASTAGRALRQQRGVPGAKGGHGPICYEVLDYRPGNAVTFQFFEPRGSRAHVQCLVPHAERVTLRHVLEMDTLGLARSPACVVSTTA